MTDKATTVGIDVGPQQCFVARVENQSGRPQIKALARFNRERLSGHPLLAHCRRVFSVADDHALVKRLAVDPVEGYRIEDLARFEMSQCMIEAQAAFHFQVAAGSGSDVVLGCAVHREHFERLKGLVAVDDGVAPAEFHVRAVALAKGHRTYCRSGSGELEVLMDLGADVASIAVVHRGDLVDTAFLKLDRFDLECDHDRRRLCRELRTVVNFRLADLAHDGVSVPPSAVMISGENSRPEVYEAMASVFACRIAPPQLSPAFFPNRTDLDRLPLALYLVALGLTA
ncbi:MAG: hypothetical protein ABIE70_08055 [bacterium]